MWVLLTKTCWPVHGLEIVRYCEENGVALIMKQLLRAVSQFCTLVNSLASDKITSAFWVVNGTSNFMMTKMVEEGWSYEDACGKRTARVFAEK